MSRTRSVQGLQRRRGTPAKRRSPDTTRLLDRILDAPHLAQVVPRLSPEVLHRIIQTCGLEDCGELIALTTPGQLARVLDLDLWRPASAGLDEELDADRFGVWLAVLMDSGAAAGAQKLATVDVEIAIAALAQHVLVFDRAAVEPTPVDGEELPERPESSDRTTSEIGSYVIEAKRGDAWDAILGLLLQLDSDDPVYFHRLMEGCRDLSNSGYEIDGLDDLLENDEQNIFDLAVDREGRRGTEGYVAPAQARAFLQSARKLKVAGSAPPRLSPIVAAYFQALEWTPPDDPAEAGPIFLLHAGSPAVEISDAMAVVAGILVDAGVVPDEKQRALPSGSADHAAGVPLLQLHLQFARDSGEAVYSARAAELAFLTNAIFAGCSIQGRPFTEQEAARAAAAACNIGLENWPAAWGGASMLRPDFLVAHDLIGVFQVGWAVLHDDVSMEVASRLLETLRGLRHPDRELQRGLHDLRIQLTTHCRAGTPWLARTAMEAIMALDMPAWATLLALLDECPVIHAAMGSSRGRRGAAVSASAFEFISENRQIEAVREYMQSLPETLRP